MHPACSRLILALPAFLRPSPPGIKAPVHDVDHRLALDACRVFTNDAFKAPLGFLSKDRAGHDPLPPPRPDDGLPPGEYFYHLGPPSTTAPSTNYPIVTDFDAWKFPIKIPDHWVRPKPSPEEMAELQRKYGGSIPEDMPSALGSDDKGCVLCPMSFSSVDVAHLVPQTRIDWFRRNNMARYNWAGASTGIHDPANGVILRKDLAIMLREHGLVFFPAGRGDAECDYRGHICNAQFADYIPEGLHRAPVRISSRVSDAFLFAQFAHTIIGLVEPDSAFDVFPLPDGARASRKKVVQKKHITLEDEEEDSGH